MTLRRHVCGTRRSRQRGRSTIAGAVVLVLGGCIQGSPVPEHTVEGGNPRRGRELVVHYACGSCHEIPRVYGARGRVGPPLTRWAERQYIAGNLRNQPDNLIAWLMDPQRFEPNTAMPNQLIAEREARDIAAFLYTIGDANPLGPPHLMPLDWLERIGKVRRIAPTH